MPLKRRKRLSSVGEKGKGRFRVHNTVERTAEKKKKKEGANAYLFGDTKVGKKEDGSGAIKKRDRKGITRSFSSHDKTPGGGRGLSGKGGRRSHVLSREEEKMKNWRDTKGKGTFAPKREASKKRDKSIVSWEEGGSLERKKGRHGK